MLPFALGGGSVIGSGHSMPGQPGAVNNHDAFAMLRGGDFLTAVVCDGCGGKIKVGDYIRSPNNEVGAKIAVRLLTRRIELMRSWFLSDQPLPSAFWDRLQLHVTSELVDIADRMGSSLTTIVKDYFMFTVVGLLVTPSWTYVFSIGDGVYALNGDVHVLGPFTENAPPYLAYGITGSALSQHTPELLRFAVHETIATESVRSVLIGTDGVKDLLEMRTLVPDESESSSPLAEFWEQSRYVRNADMIRRRLATINRETVTAHNNRIVGGPLADDTTLVVLQRVSEPVSEVTDGRSH